MIIDKMQMQANSSLQGSDADRINSFIYFDLTSKAPSRYQMVKYSTWRIYLFNELEGESFERSNKKKIGETYCTRFKSLAVSKERSDFYSFIHMPSGENYSENLRLDNISHFICRMLYCQEESTHQAFVSLEKRILEERLLRLLGDKTYATRQEAMRLMKKMLIFFKGKENGAYDIPQEVWTSHKEKIVFSLSFGKDKKDEYSQLYAKIPFNEGEIGIRKRKSFVHKGEVFVNTDTMVDIVLSNYESYLHQKLDKTRPIVTELLTQDTDNQFSSFLTTTIKQINEEGLEDTKFNGKFNLTLRNIEMVANKFFPPCMLNLNQNLRSSHHLRHDGRRQLWGFFKACGMDVNDNKEYFRRYFEGKVTASEMKTHMYNIEHAYGLQGKRKAEHAWMCRNIISGAAPKKGEHHGCPFAHWRSEELSSFLRRNYKLSEENLDKIMEKKQEKHFQVACGRLFEYSDANRSEVQIPAEITSKLGRAPYLYYEAGMQLREKKHKGTDKEENKSNIDF